MVEVMRRGFNEYHMTQVPMTVNLFGEKQMMEQVAEHVGMSYPDTPDSRYVAQPVNDFLFPWEEAGSAENTLTIDEDESLHLAKKTQTLFALCREKLKHFCFLSKRVTNFSHFVKKIETFFAFCQKKETSFVFCRKM